MDSAPHKRITGTVKWFNAKEGFGFITRHDTGEDIFVHKSSILKPNRRHSTKSVGDGEEVEFGIIASKVTGPGFKSVKGSPFVAQRGGRKSRPGSRANGRSKESGRKEDSEGDKSEELEKRTQALTIESDSNAVEYERLVDKASSDECGEAKSAESISSVTAEQ